MVSPSLSEARSEEINLVKKKNTKSKAWIYFGLRANEIGQIVEEHSTIQYVISVEQLFVLRMVIPLTSFNNSAIITLTYLLVFQQDLELLSQTQRPNKPLKARWLGQPSTLEVVHKLRSSLAP